MTPATRKQDCRKTLSRLYGFSRDVLCAHFKKRRFKCVGVLRQGQENILFNTGTVEGLTHRDLPLLTIQYHSEASPGPLDNEYIFDRFMEMVDQHRS